MTQEDIHRASREIYGTWATEQEIRFATIIAAAERKQYEHTLALQKASYEREIKIEVAAEREKVAHWMRSMGYATGHGDTIEDLLEHLGTQIAEGLLMEREACAKVCETLRPSRREFSKLFYDACTASADSIRARGNK